MPKKETRRKTSWSCEKCGWDYETEEEAIRCENRVPERTTCNGPKWENWQPGDIALVDFSDRMSGGGFRLAKIDRVYESHHYIRPYFVAIDGLGDLPVAEPGEDYDVWEKDPMHIVALNAHVLDQATIKRLIKFGELLKKE